MAEKETSSTSGIGKYKLINSIKEKFSSVFYDETVDISSYLVYSTLFLEGIHFNLVYTPLKHLAYKSVISTIAGIYDQGGTPETLIINLGLSSRFHKGNIDELFEGFAEVCKRYDLMIKDINLESSLTGLTISVTADGTYQDSLMVQKANQNDLICVTGDLGAAYLGLQVLEREWKVFDETKGAQPQLDAYQYIIGRQLKPEIRKDVPALLNKKNISSNSIAVIREGLASSLIDLCKKSESGCRIYHEKIPISVEAAEAGTEMGIEPIIAALNGGDDFEFIISVPVADHEKIDGISGIQVIGHITPPGDGYNLVLQDGNFAEIQALGWS